MPKTDVKRGRGITIRHEQVFLCSGYGGGGGGGALPVPHRIKGKIWNADNLWSISLGLGCPNMELYLKSVEFTFLPMTTVDVYYIERGHD